MSDDPSILKTLGKIGEQIDNIESHVKKLSEVVVEGNGQLPLVTRVDRLEIAESQRGDSSKKTWAMIASALGALVAGAVAIGIAVVGS